MKIEFREKALIAIESMDEIQAKKIIDSIQQLETITIKSPNIKSYHNGKLDVLILRVDNVRILFQKNNDKVLIVDVIDRANGYR